MKKIINILKKKKSLPLDKFIDIALYNKEFGYYMKKNPFGKKGDFITSPIISNLFAEMIAIWCVAFWENLGKPKKIIIAELGPGNGLLCKNLLSAFKNFNYFYKCLEIKLIEKSNKLKVLQKKNIKNAKVKWINNINEINYGPIIFIGNEFFDALPIKQIYRKKNLFFERFVVLSKNEKKLEFAHKKAKTDLVRKIKELRLVAGGNIIEYPVVGIKYLNLITKKIIKYGGGLLIFDYGYIKQKNINTLQSIKKHKYLDIFSSPSNADITSHINYQLFSKILIENKLKVEKIVTQNEFLQKLGIIERATILSNKISFKKKAEMFYKLKKLLHHKEMGQLFKVQFAKKRGGNFSLGF